MTEQEQKEANEIMAGMEIVYREAYERLMNTAPKCHFRRMDYVSGDCSADWWECSVCGHTKTAS